MSEVNKFIFTKKLVFSIVFINLILLFATLGNNYTDGLNLRQAQTAIMTRNIFYDGLNIFPTRLSFFAPFKGNMILEFPLIHFFTAITYKISLSEINGRLLNLFLYLFNGIIIYKTQKYIFNKNISLIISALYISSPLILYLAHAFMPETSTMTFYLLSYYFFIKNKKESTLKNEFLLYLSLAISVLLKPPAASIFIPIFLDKVYTKNLKLIFKNSFLLILTLLPFLCWMQYAQEVFQSEIVTLQNYDSWNWINIITGKESIIKYWISLTFYKRIIFNFLILLFNPLTFLIGLLAIAKNQKTNTNFFPFHINWTLSNFLVLFTLARAFSGHPYYQIYFIPPLLYFIGIGLSNFQNNYITRNKVINYSLILNLILSISIFSYGANDKSRISNIDEFKSVLNNNISINKKSPSEYILYSHEGLGTAAVYNYYADGYGNVFKLSDNNIENIKKEIKSGAKYIFFLNTSYGNTLNKLKNEEKTYDWLNESAYKIYESKDILLFKLRK